MVNMKNQEKETTPSMTSFNLIELAQNNQIIFF